MVGQRQGEQPVAFGVGADARGFNSSSGVDAPAPVAGFLAKLLAAQDLQPLHFSVPSAPSSHVA